ncbi:MAG: membrane protein insertase YidC [Clostridiaceae bacterium]
MGSLIQYILEVLISLFEYIHGGISNVVSNPNFSVGLTIIVFVIIIKTVLLPLNIKQIKSSIVMQKIQPEVKKIQEKYKNDPQKLNMEVMKFYKEKGANPMSGCLPMLVQWPVLIAMFWVFQSGSLSTLLTETGFLWMGSLIKPDYVLAILSAATTYVSMHITAQGQQQMENAPNPKTMNIIMSGMMLVFGFSLSAAINLYYVVSNLFQLGQTIIVKKIINSKTEVV